MAVMGSKQIGVFLSELGTFNHIPYLSHQQVFPVAWGSNKSRFGSFLSANHGKPLFIGIYRGIESFEGVLGGPGLCPPTDTSCGGARPTGTSAAMATSPPSMGTSTAPLSFLDEAGTALGRWFCNPRLRALRTLSFGRVFLFAVKKYSKSRNPGLVVRIGLELKPRG